MKSNLPKVIFTLFIFFLFPLISFAFLSFPNQIDTKQERMNVQTVLNEVMTPSPNLVVDGVLGRKSIQAVQAFQEVNGLVADGKIGPITRAELENAQTLGNTQTTRTQTNINTSSSPECSSGALFSNITGKPCSTFPITLSTGCTSTTLFSPVTGVSCGNMSPILLPTIPITTAPVITPPVVRSGGGGGSSPAPTCSGSTSQSCTITNGTGSQSRTCNSGTWSNYGTCSLISCNSGYQISGNTCALIIIPDTTKPVITSFTIPSTSSSLTVSISSLSATDNTSVTGYLLTESSTTPSASSGSWTTTKPTSYTFLSQGSKTLYSWTKDSAGNVSTGASDGVTITLPTTGGNTYYISSSGNDGDNGTSTSTPWKTIAKVNAQTFLPGNFILFKKGDTFVGRLNVPSSGTAGLPITFGAYGTGANPIIDGGAVNTRCISLTGKSYVTIDGIDVKNATTGSGIFADATSTNVIIKNLTVSDIGTTNANIWGIDIRGDNSIVTYSTIRNIAGGGIINESGNNNIITHNDVSLTNAYYTGNGAGAGIQVYAGDNTEIAYNTIHNTGGVGEINSVHGIYIGHLSTNQNTHHNTITGSSRGGGIKFVPVSGNVHNNYVTTSYTGGIMTGDERSSSMTVSIYNNISTGNGRGIWQANGGTGNVLSIYNNTLYLNNNTARDSYNSEIEIDDNLTTLIIKNNIIYATANEFPYAVQTQSNATINNNCVYVSSGSPAYYNNITRSWATWQGLGFDVQSVNSNPLMVNPPTDFHLQAGSPCRNAGVNVGLTTDYAGNPINGTPDIGAYEYGEVLGVTTYNFTLNLKYGSSGNEVKELQKILISIGYLKGTPDGIFGTLTLNAVKEYQKANGLTPDGVVGSLTRQVLNK